MGTTLAGQNIESFYISLEHLNPISIGLNCATGPEFMRDHIRSLSGIASVARLVVTRTRACRMRMVITMSHRTRLLRRLVLLPNRAG